MRWPFVSSLRARLLLLVLVALIPTRGLGIYTTWEMRQAARTEALRDAMGLARITSTAGERLIEGTHQVLTILARLPEVRRQDAAACSKLFADLLKSYPHVSNLGTATPNGDVFCSAVPFEGVANIADRTYFQQAVARRDFAPGEYRIGRIYDSLYFCRRWEGNTDAALSVEQTNRHDHYKDRLRTLEISARRKMNGVRGWRS